MMTTDRDALAKKVWQQLAQRLHPDKEGGSAEMMVRVNQVRGNTAATLKLGEEVGLIEKQGYDDSQTYGERDDFLWEMIPMAAVAKKAGDRRPPHDLSRHPYIVSEVMDETGGLHCVWCDYEKVQQVYAWMVQNIPAQPVVEYPQTGKR